MNLPNKLTVLRVIMVPFFVFFMLTDIMGESSELLCYGENSNKLIEEAFPGAACTRDGSYLLTGVVSRKKQLIPSFMSTIQQNG